MQMTRTERFWSKVDRDGPIPAHRPDLGPCWLWTAGTARGYPRFWDGERDVYAYRWAYEQECGPIADGLEFDHLCRTILCVRRQHVEPVPHRTNVLRGFAPSARAARRTACAQGHTYTAETTLLRRGRRVCRICKSRAHAAYQKRYPERANARNRLCRARQRVRLASTRQGTDTAVDES